MIVLDNSRRFIQTRYTTVYSDKVQSFSDQRTKMDTWVLTIVDMILPAQKIQLVDHDTRASSILCKFF